ncbi:hypothetical protein RND71_015985 [Anisodus tanguticus]|uniref:Uncharacterized protein n=1 Tax=Anisodus tanguticus TaxID=243964 RepID=A0AAE1VDC8_9SOLA|nr:hypothetical protein RND71_015985 [Anisodus tanguticus]
MAIVIGNLKEARHPDTLRAVAAEFISMFVFGLASEGCAISFINTLTSDGAVMPGGGLISVALSHAFSLFVAVSVSLNISGGHVNPAVTFAAFIGGHITFYRSVLYWIAQLIGSVMALFLLKFATGGLGNTEVIAPIAIGFIVGANTLTADGLYGAVMNPAMAFGQAVDSWKWESHWIYWLGPFVGLCHSLLWFMKLSSLTLRTLTSSSLRR